MNYNRFYAPPRGMMQGGGGMQQRFPMGAGNMFGGRATAHGLLPTPASLMQGHGMVQRGFNGGGMNRTPRPGSFGVGGGFQRFTAPSTDRPRFGTPSGPGTNQSSDIKIKEEPKDTTTSKDNAPKTSEKPEAEVKIKQEPKDKVEEVKKEEKNKDKTEGKAPPPGEQKKTETTLPKPAAAKQAEPTPGTKPKPETPAPQPKSAVPVTQSKPGTTPTTPSQSPMSRAAPTDVKSGGPRAPPPGLVQKSPVTPLLSMNTRGPAPTPPKVSSSPAVSMNTRGPAPTPPKVSSSPGVSMNVRGPTPTPQKMSSSPGVSMNIRGPTPTPQKMSSSPAVSASGPQGTPGSAVQSASPSGPGFRSSPSGPSRPPGGQSGGFSPHGPPGGPPGVRFPTLEQQKAYWGVPDVRKRPYEETPQDRGGDRSDIKRQSFSGSQAHEQDLLDQDDPHLDPQLIVFDHYNSDLHFKIDPDGYGAQNLIEPDGFAFCWAGARSTYGATRGRVCFEVLITKHLPADFGEGHTEPDPHVVRIGWSINASSFQLGEESNSFGYGGTGRFSTNCKFSVYGERFGKGDVILAMLDYEARPPNVSYSKNGKWLGVASPLRGWSRMNPDDKALFPHVLCKNSRVEVNFGQRQPWFRPPPSFSFIAHVSPEQRVRGMTAPARKQDCEMIMMVGLPGCGKTTWALNTEKNHPDKRYNVMGTDSLIEKMKVMGLPRRRNFGGRWDALIKRATNCLNKLFTIGSRRCRNYILDQTNVYASARKRKLRNFHGYKRICAVLVTDDTELVRRSEKRTKEEGKEVPENAVLEMKANFSLPLPTDQFVDEIVWIEYDQTQAQPFIDQYNEDGGKGGKKGIRFTKPNQGGPAERTDNRGERTDNRFGDRRQGDRWQADNRQGNQRADDRAAGDRRVGDHRPSDHRPGDHRPGDLRSEDHRPGDRRPGDHRSGDSRQGDMRQSNNQPANLPGDRRQPWQRNDAPWKQEREQPSEEQTNQPWQQRRPWQRQDEQKDDQPGRRPSAPWQQKRDEQQPEQQPWQQRGRGPWQQEREPTPQGQDEDQPSYGRQSWQQQRQPWQREQDLGPSAEKRMKQESGSGLDFIKQEYSEGRGESPAGQSPWQRMAMKQEPGTDMDRQLGQGLGHGGQAPFRRGGSDDRGSMRQDFPSSFGRGRGTEERAWGNDRDENRPGSQEFQGQWQGDQNRPPFGGRDTAQRPPYGSTSDERFGGSFREPQEAMDQSMDTGRRGGQERFGGDNRRGGWGQEDRFGRQDRFGWQDEPAGRMGEDNFDRPGPRGAGAGPGDQYGRRPPMREREDMPDRFTGMSHDVEGSGEERRRPSRWQDDKGPGQSGMAEEQDRYRGYDQQRWDRDRDQGGRFEQDREYGQDQRSGSGPSSFKQEPMDLDQPSEDSTSWPAEEPEQVAGRWGSQMPPRQMEERNTRWGNRFTGLNREPPPPPPESKLPSSSNQWSVPPADKGGQGRVYDYGHGGSDDAYADRPVDSKQPEPYSKDSYYAAQQDDSYGYGQWGWPQQEGTGDERKAPQAATRESWGQESKSYEKNLPSSSHDSNVSKEREDVGSSAAATEYAQGEWKWQWDPASQSYSWQWNAAEPTAEETAAQSTDPYAGYGQGDTKVKEEKKDEKSAMDDWAQQYQQYQDYYGNWAQQYGQQDQRQTDRPSQDSREQETSWSAGSQQPSWSQLKDSPVPPPPPPAEPKVEETQGMASHGWQSGDYQQSSTAGWMGHGQTEVRGGGGGLQSQDRVAKRVSRWGAEPDVKAEPEPASLGGVRGYGQQSYDSTLESAAESQYGQYGRVSASPGGYPTRQTLAGAKPEVSRLGGGMAGLQSALLQDESMKNVLEEQGQGDLYAFGVGATPLPAVTAGAGLYGRPDALHAASALQSAGFAGLHGQPVAAARPFLVAGLPRTAAIPAPFPAVAGMYGGTPMYVGLQRMPRAPRP